MNKEIRGSSVVAQLAEVAASVAEPPLFGAAPASDVRGPGANSGSRQKRAAPAPDTNIF